MIHPLTFFGFGIVVNKASHWFTRKDFNVFADTPLVMHYVNPDQCVIVLRSSLQKCKEYNLKTIDDSTTDRLIEKWENLPWGLLCENDQEPRWQVWLYTFYKELVDENDERYDNYDEEF